ncbi:MAG TPA: DUF3108 domain-containing protein, partial [Plantibacter sp.]|uniref:DUF3108 domain-containing protein n=1 Tax=Plantibacter sp. TaxID=1871045 RepID=UPI002B6AD069|nr:DUF3108 domain-containing protein [Plantibacter sp.]
MQNMTFAAVGTAALIMAASLGAQTRKPAPKPGAPASKPAAAATKAAQAVPFKVGETLTYDVSWSSYVTAATATMAVRERKGSYGSQAYYIVAEGRPTALVSKLYDLYYKADTLLDVFTLLPQRGSVFSQEGKRQRMKTTMFNH